MQNENQEKLQVELLLNPRKTDALQPDCTGNFTLNQRGYSVIAYLQETRDKQRNYWSISVYDEAERRQAKAQKLPSPKPIGKTKVYQFAGTGPSDPPFAANESMTIGDTTYWAAIRYSGEIDEHNPVPDVTLELSTTPYKAPPSALALANMAAMLKRQKELEVAREEANRMYDSGELEGNPFDEPAPKAKGGKQLAK